MRPRLSIAWSLGAATLAPVFLALAISIAIRLPREAEAFLADAARDHESLAGALAGALTDVWAEDGRDAALELLRDAAARTGDSRVRFVDAPDLNAGDREALSRGRTLTRTEDRVDEEHVVTLHAVRVSGTLQGAIIIDESLVAREAFLVTSVLRSVFVLVSVGALASLLGLVVARRRVVRPLEEMLAHAQRIGSGDFSPHAYRRRADEIGLLGEELNAMSARLARSHRALADESEARARALSELRHAERLSTTGKLASGLAHELGTPLHVVMARARRIARSVEAPPAIVEEARQILEDADRMARLVRQLMDFARRPKVHQDPLDALALADEALRVVSPMADTRGVTVALSGANARGLTLVGDKEALLQVLTNLLVNAILASPRGGEVELAVAPGVDGARFVVTDRGTGMTRDVAARVFEPFFTTRPVGEGTGLGLSVAWGIAVEHGGRIEVESAVGVGSAFTLVLPGPGALSARVAERAA